VRHKVVLLILSGLVSACAGEVRFSRPGEYVAPPPPAVQEKIVREENFQWGQPSGQAWFVWHVQHRQRAQKLYQGLKFLAPKFADAIRGVFAGQPTHWAAYANDGLGSSFTSSVGLGIAAEPPDVQASLPSVQSFFEALIKNPTSRTESSLVFTQGMDRLSRGIRSTREHRRWFHVFVADVSDVFPDSDGAVGVQAQLFKLQLDAIDKLEGFSKARVQVTFSYLPEARSRDRCPRLAQWEGRRWSRLRENLSGASAVGSEIDACDLMQGEEAPMRRLAEEAAAFQSRLILSRPAVPQEIELLIDGAPVRREDFSYNGVLREVTLHESILQSLSIGTPITIRYSEVLP
jgi:hypothetical protein